MEEIDNIGPRGEFGPIPTGKRPPGPPHQSLPTAPTFPVEDVIDNVAVVTIPAAHFDALAAHAMMQWSFTAAAEAMNQVPIRMMKALGAWQAAFGGEGRETVAARIESLIDVLQRDHPSQVSEQPSPFTQPGYPKAGVIDNVAVMTLTAAHYGSLNRFGDMERGIRESAASMAEANKRITLSLKVWGEIFSAPPAAQAQASLEPWCEAFPDNRPVGEAPIAATAESATSADAEPPAAAAVAGTPSEAATATDAEAWTAGASSPPAGRVKRTKGRGLDG